MQGLAARLSCLREGDACLPSPGAAFPLGSRTRPSAPAWLPSSGTRIIRPVGSLPTAPTALALGVAVVADEGLVGREGGWPRPSFRGEGEDGGAGPGQGQREDQELA